MVQSGAIHFREMPRRPETSLSTAVAGTLVVDDDTRPVLGSFHLSNITTNLQAATPEPSQDVLYLAGDAASGCSPHL